MTKPLKVAVIGFGTAGPAFSLFAAKLGHKVHLFEKFKNPKPIGSGILLQPIAMKVLDELNLLQKSLQYGQKITRLYGYTDRNLFKPWHFTNDLQKNMVLDLNYKFLQNNYFGLGIHRGTLFNILYEAINNEICNDNLKLFCNYNITKLEECDRGVFLYKDYNEKIDEFYDLVVVSTGTHSNLNHFNNVDLNNNSKFRNAVPYEFGSLWTTVKDNNLYLQETLLQKYRNATHMSGLLPIGKLFNNNNENNSINGNDNLMSIFWSLQKKDYLKFQQLSNDGNDFKEFKEEMINFWPNLEFYLNQIKTKDEFTFAQYNDVKMSQNNWTTNHIVYIGDYSHGTSPQLGQGAGLALMDAFILYQCLLNNYNNCNNNNKNEIIKKVLFEYKEKRKDHINGYRFASRILTPFFQSNLNMVSYFRDLTFPLLCKLPLTHWFMLRTLTGVQNGWFKTLSTEPTF
ncbi:hypothetical protein ABK040_012638 [Willaertia magna]